MYLKMYTCILVYICVYITIDLKISQFHVSVCLCHLKIKSGLFFNDLKFKSVLPWNCKKDVI